jgi:hypothetical protein
MKRSILILSVIAFIALLFTGFSGSLKATKTTDTCCQKFQIVSTGTPLTGCVISIVWPGYVLQCTPDRYGKCSICNIPSGNTYTVEARCDGDRKGSTKFTACTNDYVTIPVK